MPAVAELTYEEGWWGPGGNVTGLQVSGTCLVGPQYRCDAYCALALVGDAVCGLQVPAASQASPSPV